MTIYISIWFLLKIILMVAYVTADPFKMVIIYGQPVDYNYVLMKSFGFNSCVAYCYSMSTCAAVYSLEGSETCIVFEFGQISTLKQLDGASGKLMGVKMLSANATNCSTAADGNSMKTGYQINSTLFKAYTITTSSDIWTLTPGPLESCPKNFTLFVRPLGPWCIGVITIPTCISQNNSKTACANTYGGVLSGLQTTDETNLVISIGRPLISLQTQWNTYGFWINGERKASCKETVKSATCNGTNEFDYNDPLLTAYDGYTWANQQPSGVDYVPSTADCLNLYFRTDVILGVDDYRCGTASLNTICYKGYVCGKRPS